MYRLYRAGCCHQTCYRNLFVNFYAAPRLVPEAARVFGHFCAGKCKKVPESGEVKLVGHFSP